VPQAEERAVVAYGDLVAYLLQQGGPTARRGVLGFEGANTVVFTARTQR
jgi:hypothetical protein